MRSDDVLTLTNKGIYCQAGDFYIDPQRPVPRALITHGHADHARAGHDAYLCTDLAAPVMRHRLGDIAIQTVPYGQTIQQGDARVSFHPAGHVPGSAQIRVEVKGEVWVVSGDYKLEDDGISTPFEPVPCDAFITECTFGLPVFHWPQQAAVYGDINQWWAQNVADGRVSVLSAYSLGKAQRVLAGLDRGIGPILTHPAVEATNRILRSQGISALPPTVEVSADTTQKTHPGAIIVAPPGSLEGNWTKSFGPLTSAFASGWMAMRGVRRQRNTERGFVMSDHADWPGLNAAVAATGARRIFATHGYTQSFSKWLGTQGYDAGSI